MIVSFDFDDTMSFGGRVGNDKILAKIREHMAAGDICIVVTARSKEAYSIAEIEGFISDHQLDIQQCYYTNHEAKGPFLKHIGAEIHYDDADHHLDSALDCGVKVFKVTGYEIVEYKPSGTSFERVLQRFKEINK